MIIAAGVYVFELAGLVVGALGVRSIEEEAFNFIRRVQSVIMLLVQARGKSLEDTAHIRRIGLATLVDDFSEHHHLAGTEHVRRSPVECGPVNTQTQIAFALRRKAAN